MKKLIAGVMALISISAIGQDSTKGNPVEIFSSQKVINANTTHLIPKGKMEFHVAHLYGPTIVTTCLSMERRCNPDPSQLGSPGTRHDSLLITTRFLSKDPLGLR